MAAQPRGENCCRSAAQPRGKNCCCLPFTTITYLLYYLYVKYSCIYFIVLLEHNQPLPLVPWTTGIPLGKATTQQLPLHSHRAVAWLTGTLQSSRGPPVPHSVITQSTSAPAMSSPGLLDSKGVIGHREVYRGRHGRLSSFLAIATTALVVQVQYLARHQRTWPAEETVDLRGGGDGHVPRRSHNDEKCSGCA